MANLTREQAQAKLAYRRATSKIRQPENDADVMADAAKIKVILDSGVSEEASNNGCTLFAASAFLLAIAAVVVGIVT